LSTIAAMDRLVVMDRGRIVEVGDHKTLLAAGGIYARLWSHQSGGFLAEDLDEGEVSELGDPVPAPIAAPGHPTDRPPANEQSRERAAD
ncbi:MAG: hypothetical protein Q8R98_13485, partial [Rubrivivax sp.]|nr:hypothetical protein [Rubrivivax sp.]